MSSPLPYLNIYLFRATSLLIFCLLKRHYSAYLSPQIPTNFICASDDTSQNIFAFKTASWMLEVSITMGREDERRRTETSLLLFCYLSVVTAQGR